MKKHIILTLAIVLCLVFAIALVGCDGFGGSKDDAKDDTKVDYTPTGENIVKNAGAALQGKNHTGDYVMILQGGRKEVIHIERNGNVAKRVTTTYETNNGVESVLYSIIDYDVLKDGNYIKYANGSETGQVYLSKENSGEFMFNNLQDTVPNFFNLLGMTPGGKINDAKDAYILNGMQSITTPNATENHVVTLSKDGLKTKANVSDGSKLEVTLYNVGTTKIALPDYVDAGVQPDTKPEDKPVVPDVKPNPEKPNPDEKPIVPDVKPGEDGIVPGTEAELDAIVAQMQKIADGATFASDQIMALGAYGDVQTLKMKGISSLNQGINRVENGQVTYHYHDNDYHYVVIEEGPDMIKFRYSMDSWNNTQNSYNELNISMQSYANRANYKFDAEKNMYYIERDITVQGIQMNGREYMRYDNGKIIIQGRITSNVITEDFEVTYFDIGTAVLEKIPQKVIDCPITQSV